MLPQVGPVLGVEPGAGLVEEEHLGPMDDPEGDVQSAPLAARVRLDPPIGELDQVEQAHELVGPGGHRGQVPAVQAALEDQVLPTRGQVVGPAQLAHVADTAAYLLRLPGHVESGHRGRAGIDGQEGGQHAQGGRLAGTVWSEEAEDLAAAHLDAHPADGLHGPIGAAGRGPVSAVAGAPGYREGLLQAVGDDDRAAGPVFVRCPAHDGSPSVPSPMDAGWGSHAGSVLPAWSAPQSWPAWTARHHSRPSSVPDRMAPAR